MRDELYVTHPQTTERRAVPRQHYEKVLKAEGWVIDPNGPSAGDVDPKTVKAAEKKLDKAAETRESDAA